MSCGLLNAVESLSPRTISVVGLAKNCGKTTALNHLIAGYRAASVAVGATSAGRDGETIDAITRKAKPAIELPAGTPVVTSEGTLPRWTAPHEILSRLDVRTAMGGLLVARTTGPGMVELAGAPSVSSIMRSVEELRALGAERVLIDGALDRVAVGHPGLADAVVLATGAVLAGSTGSVAAIASHRASLLQLPQPPASTCLRLAEIAADLGSHAAAVKADFTVKRLDASALSRPELVSKAARGAKYLVCGGAVTGAIAGALAAKGARVKLVAVDPTKVFLEADELARWRGAGGELLVLRRVRLAAIVTNPHNPTGPDLDAGEMAAAVAAAVPSVPVFDVVARIAMNTGALEAASR